MSSGQSLRERIITLAGRADDNPRVAADLVDIAALIADRVSAVSYASVTGVDEGAYVTVAASSDLALQVDDAQYADGAGPCLDAFDTDHVVAVPDIPVAMAWPGFRDTAYRLGLRASLSIPLFAGRGTTIAALNLYAHDPDAMRDLTTAVWTVYEADAPPGRHLDGLDAGGSDLVAGLAGAFAVRARIQQAIGVLMSATGDGTDAAFTALRRRAAETGATLPDAATRLLAEPGKCR